MGDRYTNIIDAFAVDGNEMRVSGRANIVPSDARELGYDGEVLVVMLGRMSTPTFRETKDSDVIRVDVMKPIEARVVTSYADRRKLMDKMGFEHEAQITLSFNGDDVETGPVQSPITLLTPLTGNLEDEDDPLLGEESPVEGVDEASILDDSSITDDFTVEGEDEPESDRFDELFAQVRDEPEVNTEEEEFLNSYFNVGSSPTSPDRDEQGRAIVSGQAGRDERLRKFLES